MRPVFLALLLVGVIFNAAQAQTVNQSELLKQILNLPAPPPVNALEEKVKREHPLEFYAAANVPPDDAPLEDLLDYWEAQNRQFDRFRYNQTPSEETVKRLLEAIEKDQELLRGYLNLLPTDAETVATVRRIYDNKERSGATVPSRYDGIRQWLRNNSDLFIDELIESSKNITVVGSRVPNQEDLIALARVDWERAQPIIEALANDPAKSELYTLAKYVQYHHAIKTENSDDIERLRGELKKLVEDKKAPHKTRDLAMDALVLGGDFEGREEWYFSLLEDETLLELQENGFTGLTTLVRFIPNNREKWLPAMLRLLDSGNPTLRSAAARNIAKINGFEDKEILKKLLPWLADPKWIKESRDRERGLMIAALGEFDIPESVPGLIAVVLNEEEEYRSAAAKALVKYKSVESIGALRRMLTTEEDLDMRRNLIEALVEIGGFSDEEMVNALEKYAVSFVSKRDLEASDDEEEAKPVSVEMSLGEYLSDRAIPTDSLVSRLLARIEALEKNAPDAADYLRREVFDQWEHPLVDLEMLARLNSSKSNLETAIKLLVKRETIRERVPQELSAMREKSSVLRGLGAVILDDQTDYRSILNAPDLNARAALLAFGRLVRLPLPVGDVAPLLKSNNPLLALAAERFLETEDSTEARTILLTHFKSETRLLGARLGFAPNDDDFSQFESSLSDLFKSVNQSSFSSLKFAALKKRENNLRREIAANPELIAVYAFIDSQSPMSYVVRHFKNKIVFTFNEDDARYWEKTLSPKEYEALMRYIVEKRIDNLAPVYADYPSETNAGEFLMFGRDGGRRVFFQGYGLGEPLAGLREIFSEFNTGARRLHYRLADKISGLEVLLADENLRARAVWKNGADWRVLVEDKITQQSIEEELEKQENDNKQPIDYEKRVERRIGIVYKHFSWRQFNGGKISAETIAEPAGIKYLTSTLRDPSLAYRSSFIPDPPAFMRRTAEGEVMTLGRDILRFDAAGAKTVLKTGFYQNPLTSTDQKWVVAGQGSEGFYEPNGVVRINLQTGREYKINIAPADDFYPVALVPSQNKILLYRAKATYYGGYRGKNNPSPPTPEHYLLDPATGAATIVKGEFRPLTGQTYRGLQAAGAPHEFWVAIYDEKQNVTEVGYYNALNFSFKPVLRLPEIKLDSMNIWIDEPAAKIYLVYESHLLSAPFKIP